MTRTAIGKLRQTASRFRNRFRSGVLILLYHRIAEMPSDPYLLNVTPVHFAEHLEVLQQYGHLMSLQQLNQALQQKSLPHRAIVVTFDDGYADNLYAAKPLLERYAVPATVFVTAGYMNQKREFWWDELDRLLLQPGTLPEVLQLEIEGASYRWSLGKDAHYSEADQKRDCGWHLYQNHDPTLRHCLFRSVHQLLSSLPLCQRSQILNQLAIWAGLGYCARSTHRILSSDEVVELARGGLVEIGAHTMTHPVLSSLPSVAQQNEIQQSKHTLEEILEQPITSFAYPHGSRSDYTDQTMAIARKSGFFCACSNFAEMVWQGTDRFQLPRVLVYDWNKDAFFDHIKEYLGA